MFNSADLFFIQLLHSIWHYWGGKGGKFKICEPNQTDKKPPNSSDTYGLLSVFRTIILKFICNEVWWKYMKRLTSLPPCKINIKSFHSMANPNSKQVPDTNCWKTSGSTEETSVRAMQLTQVIITRSNEMTNVAISYKTTELEMKL